MKFLIYSYEHGKWWKDHHYGYTDDIDEAGRYTDLEAKDIVVSPVGIDEIAIPEQTAISNGIPKFHPYEGKL